MGDGDGGSDARSPCRMFDPRLVKNRPTADSIGGAAVDPSALEVRALFDILNIVARGVSLTGKPERDIAALLRDEVETALLL
jgi:hypothetical protein